MKLTYIPACSNPPTQLRYLLAFLVLCPAYPGSPCLHASESPEVRVVEAPAAGPSNPLYVGNRAPLTPSPFLKLPIGSISPNGWLADQLKLEAQGMTGRLEKLSKWCKFEGNAWASPTGQGHSGWEELPYWLKGYGDLGYVLNDETIISNARIWIDAVLASQEPDGWFGPRSLKTGLEGKPDLWPHMVMCNVLQSFYEYSADSRVLPFLTKYLQWLNTQPGEDFGAGYWPKIRFGDNIETIYWLYNRTGESWLLGLAQKIHQNMARWDTGVINWHNVNLAQGFREPAVYYQQAGDPRFLQAAERNYQQVMSTYGQFPGGGFAGDENCRPGFTDPRQGFETCGIVEFMHSFEMLTRISGNPVWADRCEELAFNSLPAAMTPQLKGLHYLTCANQIQLDKGNKAPEIQNDGTMFAYSPYEVYRCCQHNVSHGWPYYAEELWLATADRGLCASLYSASEVKAQVGDGAVRILEETDYPFGETVYFVVRAAAPVKFPIYLRVPRWCANPAVKINGKHIHAQATPLSYLVLTRTWQDGDTVTLDLPMKVSVRKWQKNQNAVSVDYGPLTFSLKIQERWTRYGGSPEWPEFEVFPDSPWNYGLELNTRNTAKSFKVHHKPGPLPAQPFTPDSAPIELRVNARKIPAWQQDKLGLVGKLQPGPVKSDQPLEKVTLIPMGAARLRISSFPVIGHGADAHEWNPEASN
jgi:beta-L-arabinofuranosidase (glycosyl hydrolase family 127)/glycosyl hydrolase family 127 (putative beta-L-arabinofuranosidase)